MSANWRAFWKAFWALLFALSTCSIANASPFVDATAKANQHSFKRYAQLSGGLQFPGPGLGVGAGVTYVGPIDAQAGATIFGSCARVAQASLASTATSLCDLVDSAAPTSVICTLRGTPSGFVDLAGTYCSGGVTPSAKCAAATGTTCNISKVYNQISPGTNDFANTTAASQPKLTFSALNGLPGITGTNAASSALTTSGNISAALPWALVAVSKRTGSTGVTSGIFGQNVSGAAFLGYAGSANTALLSQAAPATGTANDNTFYSLIGTVDAGGAATLYANGSSVGTSSGYGAITSTPMRILRSANGAVSMDGTIMEFILYPATTINASTVSSNQRSATNGYNF